MKTTAIVTGLILSFALSAFAKTAPATRTASATYHKKLNEMAPVTEKIGEPTITAVELQKVIEKSEKARTPAAAGAVGEEKMSPKLREIRDRFLAVKTSDELDSLITDLDTQYDSLPADAKFLAAQVVPMQSLRGLIFKMRTVFEKRSKAAHSVVLTLAKNITTNFRIYLPQDSMKAVHEYFMSPYYQDGQVVTVFQDEADIQGLLTGKFADQIWVANNRLANLKLSEPVVWDQRFSFGPDSFQDGLKRFRLVGELEKSLVQAAMMTTVASLEVLRAYNIDGAIDLSADIGKLYGIDGWGLMNSVDGVSAKKITRAIQGHEQIGSILPEGNTAMRQALMASRWATTYAWAAWQASSKERKDENLYAIDSGYWRVNRADIEHNLEIAYRIINSKAPEKIRSSVTGEVIEINYSKIFLNPPSNLQKFLPTGFDEKAKVTRKALTKMGGPTKDITYRNYAEGSPEAWNISAYNPYFPSITQNDDVFRTLRVLSHAGGNWLNIVK
jgi:hypothetical protein